MSLTAFGEITQGEDANVGGIAGLDEESIAQWCYWNGTSQYNTSFGYLQKQEPKDSYSFDKSITLKGKTFVTDLNKYANSNALSSWTHLEFDTSGPAFVSPALVFTKHFKLIVPPPPSLQSNETKEFDGWFMDKEFSRPYNASAVGPGHVVVHAKWKNAPSEYVEIVFDTKDMGQGAAETIIKAHTDEYFVIERFETDSETGETRVIIRFEDKAKAIEFVNKVRESSSATELIKRVDYYLSTEISLTVTQFPLKLFYLVMMNVF